jgi:hypothetical protein
VHKTVAHVHPMDWPQGPRSDSAVCCCTDAPICGALGRPLASFFFLILQGLVKMFSISPTVMAMSFLCCSILPAPRHPAAAVGSAGRSTCANSGSRFLTGHLLTDSMFDISEALGWRSKTHTQKNVPQVGRQRHASNTTALDRQVQLLGRYLGYWMQGVCASRRNAFYCPTRHAI